MNNIPTYFPAVNFDITDVPSSFIARVQYDALNKAWGDLTVTFRKGYAYTYERVSLADAVRFLTALDESESLGEVYNYDIRSRYEGVRKELTA
jgi:hypothetical protein